MTNSKRTAPYRGGPWFLTNHMEVRVKHFMSMAGTFRSYLAGQITSEDLEAGVLLFGPHQAAFGSDQAIPAFVLGHNREKPRHVQEAEYVDQAALDAPVFEQWAKFKQLVKTAIADGRVQWTDGKNYPAKAKPLITAGHEVFLDGRWLLLGELKYLDDA